VPKMSLEEALSLNGNNITALLKHFRDGDFSYRRPNGGRATYSRDAFVEDWKNGGKQKCETKWRDEAFAKTKPQVIDEDLADFYDELEDVADSDELISGKHEWIPTNMLGYVVEHSFVKRQNMRWFYLAEVLRVPTNIVVIHPKFAKYAGQGDFGISGHVEAVFIKQKSKKSGYQSRTKGQPGFHEMLRKILRAHLNETTDDIAGFAGSLAKFMKASCWLGNDCLDEVAATCNMTRTVFCAAPCPYFYKSGSGQYTSWGKTMQDMSSRLQQEWQVSFQYLEKIFNSVKFVKP